MHENDATSSRQLERRGFGKSEGNSAFKTKSKSKRNTSGSFLLDTASLSSGRTTKRRATDRDVTKRRPAAAPSQELRKTSVGNSPLRTVTDASKTDGFDHRSTEGTASDPGFRGASSSAGELDTGILKLAMYLSEYRRKGVDHASDDLQGLTSPLGASSRRHLENASPRIGLDKRRDSEDGNAIPALLPDQIERDWKVPREFSDATLARAEKARQHFELFSLYLRLLSYLPPLRHAHMESTPTSRETGRVYNPLQAIRNRRVRFREKIHLDLETEGWGNVAKVQEWINSVEHIHGHREGYNPDQCLELPPFKDPRRDRTATDKDSNVVGTSPSSAAKKIGISGPKPQRPRFEWSISPSELLADAAWLEHDHNKSKIVDRDGNKLYPDPTKLQHVGTNIVDGEQEIPTTQVSGLGAHVPSDGKLAQTPVGVSDHASHNDGSTRRRHRRKLRNALHMHHSPNSSSGRDRSRRWIRSPSSSSFSSSGSEIPRGRSRQTSWERQLTSQLEAAINAGGMPDTLGSLLPQAKSSVDAPGPAVLENTDAGNILISPTPSVLGKEDTNLSVDIDSTAPSSPMQGPIFPSITANLSPPSSRSPSPRKRLPRVIGSLQERAKGKLHNPLEHFQSAEESSPETGHLRKRLAPESRDGDHARTLEPSPLPAGPALGESSPQQATQPESRLRGLLRNTKIAEIVGSEVSKVGDFIWRKEAGGHSRQPSYASSLASERHDSEEERADADAGTGKKIRLRREQTVSDAESRASSSKPGRRFTKPIPLDSTPIPVPKFVTTEERLGRDMPEDRQVDDRSHIPPAHNAPHTEGRSTDAGTALPQLSSKKLNADEIAMLGPSLVKGSDVTREGVIAPKRPSLHHSTCDLSLSERSIPTLTNTSLFDKREIQRCRALLLSSGIKAWAITDRASEARSPSPKLLSRSIPDPHTPLPPLPQIDGFDYAARSLLDRFEMTKTNLNKSLTSLTDTHFTPLQRDIDALEIMINKSLNPRVRAAAKDAETLGTQLNTTSTLAIKQLSDALDKGLRKRNRRVRFLRRVGFVLLEWTLVGIMWWVWLLVMIFKVIRGIGKGFVRGVRWVLWM